MIETGDTNIGGQYRRIKESQSSRGSYEPSTRPNTLLSKVVLVSNIINETSTMKQNKPVSEQHRPCRSAGFESFLSVYRL